MPCVIRSGVHHLHEAFAGSGESRAVQTKELRSPPPLPRLAAPYIRTYLPTNQPPREGDILISGIRGWKSIKSLREINLFGLMKETGNCRARYAPIKRGIHASPVLHGSNFLGHGAPIVTSRYLIFEFRCTCHRGTWSRTKPSRAESPRLGSARDSFVCSGKTQSP